MGSLLGISCPRLTVVFGLRIGRQYSNSEETTNFFFVFSFCPKVPKCRTQSQTDVFHFPEESQTTSSQEEDSKHPPCNEDLSDSSSDDFCILDHPEKEEEVNYFDSAESLFQHKSWRNRFRVLFQMSKYFH